MNIGQLLFLVYNTEKILLGFLEMKFELNLKEQNPEGIKQRWGKANWRKAKQGNFREQNGLEWEG